MGLLDDYEGINLDEIEANTFEIPDDIYSWTLGDIDRYETSDGRESLRFHYDLTNDDEKSYHYTEWFNLPEDSANLTDNDKLALGRLKTRLLSFGVAEEQVSRVSDDDLVGAFGTFSLTSSKSKKNGKTYQNIRNFRVSDEWEAGEESAPAPAPVPVAKPKATRTRKAPAAKPLPTVEEEPEAEAEPEGVDAYMAQKKAEREAAVLSNAPEPESTDDVKARIAARRAARLAAANTSGERGNPFKKTAAE